MMVLEIVSSTLTALGLGLLVAALMIRLLYGSWIRTRAITFEREGHAYLRWHDHRYRIVEALWSSATRGQRGTPAPPPRAPGEEITVFVHARRPTHWSLEAPYRGTRVIAVVGLVLAVIGAMLGFLPG